MSEKIDSSISSSLQNPDNIPDEFVVRMINGKPKRIKTRTAKRDTARRQQHLTKSDPVKYPVQAIMDAARNFDHRDPALAFSNVDSDDLRDRHTGPRNYFSAIVINTGLDSQQFLQWFNDPDFDRFPRSEVTQFRDSLLDRLGFSDDYYGRNLNAH